MTPQQTRLPHPSEHSSILVMIISFQTSCYLLYFIHQFGFNYRGFQAVKEWNCLHLRRSLHNLLIDDLYRWILATKTLPTVQMNKRDNRQDSFLLSWYWVIYPLKMPRCIRPFTVQLFCDFCINVMIVSKWYLHYPLIYIPYVYKTSYLPGDCQVLFYVEACSNNFMRLFWKYLLYIWMCFTFISVPYVLFKLQSIYGDLFWISAEPDDLNRHPALINDVHCQCKISYIV